MKKRVGQHKQYFSFDVKCYEIADREKIDKYFEVIAYERILDVLNLDSL
jgi:hypothetical protein